MAAYDFTDGTIAGSGIQSQAAATTRDNALVIRRCIVDCSLQTLDAGDADTANVIKVFAGETVVTAWINVITAETANGTVDLGDGTDADQWGDALSLATANVVVGALMAPTYYAADGYVIITATTDGADVDIDGAKLEVCALVTNTLEFE